MTDYISSEFVTLGGFLAHKKKSIVNVDSIRKALEYSENAVNLEKIIDRYNWNVQLLEFGRYFDDDKEYRPIVRFFIQNKKTKEILNFRYGMSIADMKKMENFKNYWGTANDKKKINKSITEDFLYSLLASIRGEYYAPDDIDEYIQEFGIDLSEGYNKINTDFLNWKNHSKKLNSFFNFSSEEINSLPC